MRKNTLVKYYLLLAFLSCSLAWGHSGNWVEITMIDVVVAELQVEVDKLNTQVVELEDRILILESE